MKGEEYLTLDLRFRHGIHAIETQVRFSFSLVSMVEGEAASHLYPSCLVPLDLEACESMPASLDALRGDSSRGCRRMEMILQGAVEIAIGALTRRQLSRGEDFYVCEGLVALATSGNELVFLLIGSGRIKDGSDAGRRKGEGTPCLWS